MIHGGGQNERKNDEEEIKKLSKEARSLYPPNKPASYNKEKRGLYQTSQLLSSCFIGHYRIIRTE